MTRDELQELYYIKKEIELWTEELIKFRSSNNAKSSVVTELPKGGKLFTVLDYVIQISDIEDKLKNLLYDAQLKQLHILSFIEGIDDSLIKQIIYLRNYNLLEWEDVAIKIGGGNSSEGIKKKYYRFLNSKKVVPKCPA